MFLMKVATYHEGPQALQNFKQFATAILQAQPRNKKKNAKQDKPTSRKSKRSDKD